MEEKRQITINMLRDVLDDISKNLLKTEEPIIVVDNYKWFIEVLSLMAKQVSLCRACLSLLS